MLFPYCELLFLFIYSTNVQVSRLAYRRSRVNFKFNPPPSTFICELLVITRCNYQLIFRVFFLRDLWVEKWISKTIFHEWLLYSHGEKYEIWDVIMENYLETRDLWEAVKEDREINSLSNNFTWPKSRVTRKRKSLNRRKKQFCLLLFQ